MLENEYVVTIFLLEQALKAATEIAQNLSEENKKLKAEVTELKAELARPERMTPAEYDAYWGIYG